jgi:PAS domain S-box-containing protein
MTGSSNVDARGESGSSELLWEDGERRFSRIWRDGTDGRRRAYIGIQPAREQPDHVFAARVAHEFALREVLDAAWALQPLAHVRDSGAPTLLVEDCDGRPLDRVYAVPLESERFLRVGAAVARAMARMHACGIVHKDIKAANILVDAASDRVWLTGFGVATRLHRERQRPEPPEFIAGTLSHMAPEQTGRMNRSIDSRSDLYALGVTLYHLLTGTLPFSASDSMEWVHCHVARRPESPATRIAKVEPQIAAIVMKLLAKMPEDRYQIATGVEHDLRCCLAAIEVPGEISAFALGERDRTDRLLIPERLYGRQDDIAALVSAFDLVLKDGRPRFVLVRGPPGIGKSSVVNELQKVLVPARGFFASGKFDQLSRDVPYATLALAMRDLVRPLLLKPEIELAAWRAAIRRALEFNGAILLDLIPELRHVLGELPPAPDLPPPAARARFQRVLRRFIGVFARPEHPLSLFLDDLQWLDGATLDFLDELVLQSDVQHLLLVGAYRDNEVDDVHPLRRKLEALRQAGADVREVVLGPLREKDLAHLIEDTLYCAKSDATSLARLIHSKTGGNPFFANQFLQELADERVVHFHPASGQWRWDTGDIEAKGYTENVVDLMVGKLARWPQETRQALKELACLGNQAKLSTLAIVHESSPEQMEADLWEAMRAELVVRAGDRIRFAHDRVQEAAYALVPAPERAREHLRIGRLLLARLGHEDRDEALFDIVGQLNRGAALIESEDEREAVTDLHLAAALRAKTAVAYASALNYAASGAGLLPADAWQRRHDLAFGLEILRAECEFLTGQMAASRERLEAMSSLATNAVEHCAVTSLLTDVFFAVQRPDLGIGTCLEFLHKAGIDLPLQPADAQAQAAYDQVRARLGHRSIEALADLPAMADSAARASMSVLAKLATSVFPMGKNLFSLVICAGLDLTLEHGNTDSACLMYGYAGIMIGWFFNDMETALRFNRLGLELVQRSGMQQYESVVRLTYATQVAWNRHVANCVDEVRVALDVAERSGDPFGASVCRGILVSDLLAAGEPLAVVEAEAEISLAFARKVHFGDFVNVADTQAAFVRNLRGLAPRFGTLNNERFSESATEGFYASQPHLPLNECWYFVRKLEARYFAQDYAAALAAGLQAQALLWSTSAMLEVAECQFYTALTHTALCESASEEGRQHLWAAIGLQGRLEAWARDCPENFENRALLVAAEVARLEGEDTHAMRLYDGAQKSARDNGFVHQEALANELAARFYFSRGFDKIARTYLRDARDRYVSWGADGKVRQLDDLYPHLQERDPGTHSSTVLAPVTQLDLATMTKVLQAVSGEIDLDRLIVTIMRLALEHAGAERGLLILPQGDGYRIHAEARTSGEAVTVDPRPAALNGEELPMAALQFVIRTGESVLLPDASTDPSFSGDEYVRARGARSVLCMPLHKQTRLVGVLYLENNLASGVFTPQRTELLRLLSSEAALSLENARLYRDLQEREARMRRLVDSNIVGIAIWHADGRILDINDVFLELVGYNREDFASGRVQWTDFVPPELRDQDVRGLEIIRTEGAAQTHEREYIHKSGNRVPVLAGGAIFESTPEEGVAFAVDLSELKRAEEAARDNERRFHDAEMRLTNANRVASVGQLAASIAHEINQPLAAISTTAITCQVILAEGSPNLERLGAAVRRTIRDVNRASDIVTRLRALFAKKEMATAIVDLNEATREVITQVSAGLQRDQVILRCELAEDLPPVAGDLVQLQQVISNLVRNASEAMISVEDRPRQLLISTTCDGDNIVRLDVQDAGTGLDPALADKLFEPFYTTKSEGMGVGLFVSRSIIERHNGRLWATSNEGPGSTFSFSLPRAASGAPAALP